MYYGHNLQFESAAAMFAGNLAQARDAAQRTVKLADPIADQMVMIEPFAAQELVVLVRFGQWAADPRDQAAGADARRANRPCITSRTARRWPRLARSSEAEADLTALKAAAAKIADRRHGGRRQFCAALSIAVAIARPHRADRRGEGRRCRRDQGIHRSAVGAEDHLGYNEPPDWLNPERERLARC